MSDESDDAETDRRSVKTAMVEWARRQADRLRDIAGTGAKTAPDVWRRVRSPLIHTVAIVATLVFLYGFLSWLWGAIGPLKTIVAVVFGLAGIGLIPVLTVLIGPSFPMLVRDLMGKGYWFVGMLAFGHTYLVETDTGWELCPGTEDEVYVDGEWDSIEAGDEYRSVLLGLPFGVLRHKTDTSYEDVRVDPKNEAMNGRQIADGGTRRTRAGITEATPDPNVTGEEKWLVDLVRVSADGLLNAGDAELIEQAEYDKLEDLAAGSRLDGWVPILAMLGGILMGTFAALATTGVIF